jgi:hypothetical protein
MPVLLPEIFCEHFFVVFHLLGAKKLFLKPLGGHETVSWRHAVANFQAMEAAIP